MGTQYVRKGTIVTEVRLLIDDQYEMVVNPIEAQIVIGNTLDIHLR